MTFSYPIKTAFVLGGTGSMGRAVVRRLRDCGFDVAFTGRNVDRGTELQQKSGAIFLPANVLDRDAVDSCVAAAIDKFGSIDLFVSCLGLVFAAPMYDTASDIFREIIDVNLTAVFRCSRIFMDHFKANDGGLMVHVVSDAALRSIHHIPVYSSAKAGLLVMSELFAAEAASNGVRVNAICPGATHPGVQSTVAGFETHAEDDRHWGAPPSGRHGRPDDIAKAITWLCSIESTHINGATIRIDGAASAATRGGTRA